MDKWVFFPVSTMAELLHCIAWCHERNMQWNAVTTAEGWEFSPHTAKAVDYFDIRGAVRGDIGYPAAARGKDAE